MRKELNIRYDYYEEADIHKGFSGELKRYEKAVRSAIDARKDSYSPYSRFQVGATVETQDGNLHTGANQEVSAFPSCLCAERIAIAKAQNARSSIPIKHIVITSCTVDSEKDIIASPCGSCRQALYEAQSRQKEVFQILLYASGQGLYVINSVQDLLPFGFSGEFLER